MKIKKISLLFILLFASLLVCKATAQQEPSLDAGQEESAIQKETPEQEEGEEGGPVSVEEPESYPMGQQDLYEPRDSTMRFNPQTGQYEQATPNEELRFNPSAGTWSYETPNATLQYNPQTRQWEYSDKPL